MREQVVVRRATDPVLQPATQFGLKVKDESRFSGFGLRAVGHESAMVRSAVVLPARFVFFEDQLNDDV